MEQFNIGQRWISEMEPELGLGIVTEVNNRFVRIKFPASDCERLYAIASAPIKRVQFKVGDTIKSRSGTSIKVTATTVVNGIISYQGKEGELAEEELCDATSFTTPGERLLGGFWDDNREFNLRYRVLELNHTSRKSNVRGFLGGRIDLVPHQLYVAHAVAGRPIPRVLLSDEVGLGKTIEACLIVHRLLLSGRSNRVLILVPESLVHQWFIELLRRFNLVVQIFDADYCESIVAADADTNPFLEEQLAICSIDFLSMTGQWQQQALAAGWDLVVIDEAHHLTEASPAYQLAQYLGQVTRGLLLLTATPEQLGHRSHFARLQLLDPARYHDFDIFEQEAQHYHTLVRIINKLLEQRQLTAKDRKILNKLVPGDSVNNNDDPVNDEKSRHRLIENLLDWHGTGRAVFRNTRAAMTSFPAREVHLVPLDASDKDLQEQTREFVADPGADKTGATTFDYHNDPRITWLLSLLKKHKDEKILLICRSIGKVEAIETALRHRIKIHLALFHEELTLLLRDRNAAWFAQKNGAHILLCSEIGSEGRNFQFCQHLVLFDLPDHPEILEQRIGRLDRIGQAQTIHIYVPYLKGSEYEVLVRWYHEGLNGFAKNIPGAFMIYQNLGARVRELALTKQPKPLKDLITATQQQYADIAHQLETGRDRLLELNSFRPQIAESLIQEITAIDTERSLDRLMLRIFDWYGIRPDKVANRTYRLNLELLANPAFPIPGHRQDGLIVTFDRKTALSHEDIEFLSWDHPMVTGALDLILGSEKGNCAVAVWPGTTAPELLLEAIFVLECVAPKELNVDRFLPPTPLRVVVNHLLQDCSTTYPSDQFSRVLQDVNGPGILDNPKVKQKLLPGMLDECSRLAEQQVPEIVNNSRNTMATTLNREVERLVALKKVNKNIKDEEIAIGQQEIKALDNAIHSARLRLDALRFICKGECTGF